MRQAVRTPAARMFSLATDVHYLEIIEMVERYPVYIGPHFVAVTLHVMPLAMHDTLVM